MLDRTQIGIGNELQATSNLTGRVSNSLEPRFVHQNQTLNPFVPLQKAQTSNLFGQILAELRSTSGKPELRTTLNPGPSTKIELFMNPTKIPNFKPVNRALGWALPDYTVGNSEKLFF